MPRAVSNRRERQPVHDEAAHQQDDHENEDPTRPIRTGEKPAHRFHHIALGVHPWQKNGQQQKAGAVTVRTNT